MPCLHCTQQLQEVKKRSPHAAPGMGAEVVWGERETLREHGENGSITRCGACGAVWDIRITIMQGSLSEPYYSNDPRDGALLPSIMGTLLYSRVLDEAELQQALA